MGVNDSTLRNSLAETAKRAKAAAQDAAARAVTPNNPSIPQKSRKGDGKMTENHRSLRQSSEKKSVSGRDVCIKDMLEVPDDFSLQSPLPPLETDGPAPRYHQLCEAKAFNSVKNNCYQNQDVLLADILKAPSLEISMRTATDLDCQSEENNYKIYDSNGVTEQCKPP